MMLRHSGLVQGRTISPILEGPFFRLIHAEVLRRFFLDLQTSSLQEDSSVGSSSETSALEPSSSDSSQSSNYEFKADPHVLRLFDFDYFERNTTGFGC